MKSIPVLAYHHISPDREITPEVFEAQLARLSKAGYSFISGSQLLGLFSGKEKISKPVMLTFDDGYADNWVYAYPLVKKYSAKAVVFLPCDYITETLLRPNSEEGGKIADTVSGERAPEGFLNWSEVRRMSESGFFEFGSHTLSHKGFRKNEEYGDIEKEISGSKKIIEEKLGRECFQLAWPWGEFKKEWMQLLKKNGYRLAYLYRPGPNLEGGDPFSVYRVAARPAHFLRKLVLYESGFFMSAYKNFYGLDRKAKRALLSVFKISG